MSSAVDQSFYDDAFAHIAQRSGNVTKMLDEFFSFLHRRTDFYVQFPVPERQDGAPVQYSMGFPEGRAEEMVLHAFRQYPFRNYEAEKEKFSATTPRKPSPKPATNSGISGSRGSSTVSQATVTGSFSTPTKKKPSVGPACPPSPPAHAQTPPMLQHNDKGEQIPIGNGGVGPNYVWTQTLKDLTIYVDVPISATSKSVVCDIKPSSLSLRVNDVVLLNNGSLEEPVRVSESTWTLNKDNATQTAQVIITLDKTREMWWKHVVVGHPEIDTSKVDSRKDISEYDEETQGVIRKLMFEQRQKWKNQPVNDEEHRLEELLTKAQDSESSPFPSKLPLDLD